MGERFQVPRLGRSVFAKLIAVMVAMALALPLLVGTFFLFVAVPALEAPKQELMREYMDTLATSSLDVETARKVGARHQLNIRYEGPAGAWATDPDLPPIREVEQGRARSAGWKASPEYHVVSRPDGSTYLFAWEYRRRLDAVHLQLLALLLGMVLAILLLAHALLRRTLRPLRWLQEGVSKLSEGDLEVTIPRRTEDEFGVLTDAFHHMVGRVRQMVKSRDQLLLDVSHELRSPLTRMKVALALCPDDEQHQRVHAHVTTMEAMVTELLELERLRQGRGLQMERQDLKALVREACQVLPDGKPGIRLEEPPGPVVLGLDSTKVRSVLTNLLENAQKYSLPDSQPVTLRIQEEESSIRV
ncbi:MAG: HAMP domain-containing protein, partial [Deltaproteobacteria bacterium]|nr:HAMP domain-containing protein [Deltaproteobacteria bacterium]